ncbi:MAG: biotin/lipoyl-containing protein, partial [Acidimicrobiia bacterium]
MDITMPQLGETVTEGTVTRWLKQIGEQVAPDELIFEVSTDKVDSEVPSPGAGYLAEILVPEGETVPVGTRLAVLTDAPPGESSGGGDAARSTDPSEAKEAAPEAKEAAPEAEEAHEEEPAAEQEPAAAEAAPAPEAAAEEPEPAPASKADAAKAEAPAQPEATGNGNGGAAGMLLSPVVRRLITEHELDPGQIPGTGEGGRITRSDVLAYIDKRGGGAKAPAAAQAPEAKEAPAPAPKEAPAAKEEPA